MQPQAGLHQLWSGNSEEASVAGAESQGKSQESKAPQVQIAQSPVRA